MKREDYQLDFFWSLLSDAELHSLKGKNTRIRFIHVAGFEVVVVLGGGKICGDVLLCYSVDVSVCPLWDYRTVSL